jgi:hypothetical protein
VGRKGELIHRERRQTGRGESVELAGVLAASVEGHRVSDVLNQEGLLGGNADDIVFGQLPVLTAYSFATESQPCSSTCVAVVHHKTSLLILDFRMIRADTLIG